MFRLEPRSTRSYTAAWASPVLALVLDRDGKRFLHIHKADGEAHSQELDKKFKANPAVLAFHDADQDGQMDLLVMAAYEKVKVQVVFPPLAEFKNELILERWVPWEQVYGPSEEDLEAAR